MKTINWRTSGISGGLILVLIFGFFVYERVKADTNPPPGSNLKTIYMMQTKLANKNLPSEEKTSLAKQVQGYQILEATLAKVTPADKSEPPPMLPTETPGPFPTGLFGPIGAFSSEEMPMKNRWQGIADGVLVQVLAGAATQNPKQGILIVLLISSDRRNRTGNTYRTPDETGAVTIVAESNNRLTLQSEQGNVYYFDVAGLTFVSSLTEQVAPIIEKQLPTLISPSVSPNLSYPAPTSSYQGYPVPTKP